MPLRDVTTTTTRWPQSSSFVRSLQEFFLLSLCLFLKELSPLNPLPPPRESVKSVIAAFTASHLFRVAYEDVLQGSCVVCVYEVVCVCASTHDAPGLGKKKASHTQHSSSKYSPQQQRRGGPCLFPPSSPKPVPGERPPKNLRKNFKEEKQIEPRGKSETSHSSSS